MLSQNCLDRFTIQQQYYHNNENLFGEMNRNMAKNAQIYKDIWNSRAHCQLQSQIDNNDARTNAAMKSLNKS